MKKAMIVLAAAVLLSTLGSSSVYARSLCSDCVGQACNQADVPPGDKGCFEANNGTCVGGQRSPEPLGCVCVNGTCVHAEPQSGTIEQTTNRCDCN